MEMANNNMQIINRLFFIFQNFYWSLIPQLD